MTDDIVLSLTPEQVSAIDACSGFAHATDPVSRRTYLVVDQGVAPEFEDAYLRAMLKVGIDQLERGECKEWNLEEAKVRLRERLASRP